MLEKDLTAFASVTIKAPETKVWEALVTPAIIKQYMFGAEVVSDWKAGSSITWKGILNDKPYADKGSILIIEPPHTLQFTHFSPLPGLPDLPENYHTLTYELSRSGEGTKITLSQDNNKNEKEQQHSAAMWQQMLEALKKVVEKDKG